MPDGEDIRFLPTNQLLDEVIARFDAVVFKGYKKESDISTVTMYRYHGEYPICSGLATELVHQINKDRESQSQRLSEGDA